jgi:hypothetical protein
MRDADKRNRVVATVCIATLLTIACWLLWYDAPQQKLQRCAKAQSDHFYSTNPDQELHRRGSDPPPELFVTQRHQLGVR